MKKVIFGTLFLGLIGLSIIGCEKRTYIPNKENVEEYSLNNKKLNEKEVEEKAKSYSEIACIIREVEEDAAWGTRCGTPIGECGKKITACKAVAVLEPKSLPVGMDGQEFIETWNNESSRKQLNSLGYYSIDKE